MSGIIESLSGAWSTRVAFECDCTSQEVVDRLRTTPGREAWLDPAQGLAGRTDPASMWLWLAPRGRGSFRAHFRGRVAQVGASGSRLKGEVLLRRGAIAFLGVWPVMAVLFTTAVLGYVLPTDRAGKLSGSDLVLITLAVAFLVSVPLVLAFGLREFARTRDDLVTYLAATVGGQ